ncbi:hypothetical protein [Zunongwangia endophytica]|uniref:Uncharacterized protein n=1 Tax=Zunongwangia endophytica TaxID=1808945 RepID=A0ABV8H5V0_9FLAO|nr:hypothetical protein [Zunongwangia endophytica]MDN3595288.1 hypothetical protein [Zunongwangia endophytica]
MDRQYFDFLIQNPQFDYVDFDPNMKCPYVFINSLEKRYNAIVRIDSERTLFRINDPKGLPLFIENGRDGYSYRTNVKCGDVIFHDDSLPEINNLSEETYLASLNSFETVDEKGFKILVMRNYDNCKIYRSDSNKIETL